MGRSGGGSGRSSGGGGGRSFGGRSGGGSSGGRSGGFSPSRNSRSSSSGSRGHSGGGFWGGRSNRHSHHHHHHNSSYYHGHGRGRRFSVGGFILTVVCFIILCAFLNIPSHTADSNEITKSTIIREALPKGSVVETDYYTDDIGDWISNSTKLTAGMKNFYKATGVQPYLYIADNLDGITSPTKADAEAWLNNFYDEMFEDEAHTVLLFFERNSKYNMWYLNGKLAKTVMDNEAMDILMDYVELYYYSDMTEDELFSAAYDRAGTRIMEVTKDPLPWYSYLLFLIAVIIIIVILFKIWKAKKAQKNIEDENTRKILEAPLEEINNFPEE